MFVYNISIKIHPEIEEDWIRWQKTEHIPEVMSTGLFTGCKFYRLLEPDTNDDGITYVVQYFYSDAESYQRYLNEFAAVLRQKANEKWGDQFVAFRTVMQIVN
jgi:hypothetical protein